MLKNLKIIIGTEFLVVLVVMAMAGTKKVEANVKDRYNVTYYINKMQRSPVYVDGTGTCAKLFYGAYHVAKNCSSLNLATNYSLLTTDQYYVTELILSHNDFSTHLPYIEINSYDSLDSLDLSNNQLDEFTNDLLMIDCSANYLKGMQQ